MHTAPAFSTTPPSAATESVLHRFDLLQAGLVAARAAHAAGQVDQARRVVLDQVRMRLLAQVVPEDVDTARDLAQAEGLLQRQLTLLGYPVQPLAEPIDWLMMRDRDDQWTQHLGYFKWTLSLARSWRATGNIAFAQAWRGYVADLITHCRYGRTDWGSNPSRPRVELGRRVSDNGETTQWNSLAAATRTEVLLDGLALVLNSGVVDDELLLGCIDALWRDGFLCMVNNPRSNTPNQYLHTSQSLLRLGLTLPEHVNASAAFELGLTRLRDAVARQVLRDGADLEQSTNYNYGILRLIRPLREQLPESLLAPIVTAARQRLRFLSTVHYPDGHPVEIAKNGLGADDRPMLAGFAAELGVSATLDIPGVAHPWGGWYALRSADSYLLLKACPPGAGHVHEDSLSLVLWSRGRRLLIDSGNFSYGSSTDLDRRMNAYSRDSRSHSTVLVDGHGTRRTEVQNILRGELWEEPTLRADEAQRLPNRALTGQIFALIEGDYADGYGPEAIPVRHQRRVLQVADRGWLVIDQLDPADHAEHTFTQLWQLPPAAAGLVQVSGSAVRSPDLHLLALPPADPAISVIEGREEPAGGWYFNTYGQRQSKPDVHVSWRGRGPQLALTWLADALAPAAGVPTVLRGADLRLSLPFADGQTLLVTLAAAPTALVCDDVTATANLLATLGDVGASLGDEAFIWTRTDGSWLPSPWPNLPEIVS